jgi:hypothetical protein
VRVIPCQKININIVILRLHFQFYSFTTDTLVTQAMTVVLVPQLAATETDDTEAAITAETTSDADEIDESGEDDSDDDTTSSIDESAL